ncbi:hypothetical protein GH714_012268 [Hevea brasiliensis]|uniref:DUF641 domain-containing protein n=1 Tax=Hevea brasiliensis TaxID=3981 RepID=A0A6A6LNG6_HEVBR|nr:hypothetical protein GH714_012268 [Hevea brasiliensis]
METIKCRSVPSNKSKIARTFQKVINLKTATRIASNNGIGICILTPQSKFQDDPTTIYKSHISATDKHKDDHSKAKRKAVLDALLAKLFAGITTIKAAYAELQMAQNPYCSDAIHAADQAIVEELKLLSELKRSFFKNELDHLSPQVTVMLAEIQEQQSLMKTYEITIKKLESETKFKDSDISLLKKQLDESIAFNKSFVKLMVREMEVAEWDIEAAAKAIESESIFPKPTHRCFVFESFVSKTMFEGFNYPNFMLPNESPPPMDHHHHYRHSGEHYFNKFKKLKSVNPRHYLNQNPTSSFARFTRAKYLKLVHAKMECSLFGNLNQRKLVNSGGFPDTAFFTAFIEMARRVWSLNLLAFSFGEDVSIFQVSKNSRFSEVYMESVTQESLLESDGVDADLRVDFTVVPGFKIGKTLMQSQFSTPIGSGALTLLKALIMACLIYVPGAAFAGNRVVNDLISDFLKENQPDEGFLMWSMVVVLVTAAIWLALATYLELPVSSQQSIHGALLGTILVTKGFGYIPMWNKKIGNALSVNILVVIVAVAVAVSTGVLLSLVINIIPLGTKLFNAIPTFKSGKQNASSMSHQSKENQDKRSVTKEDVEDVLKDITQMRVLETVYEEEERSWASPDIIQDSEQTRSVSEFTTATNQSTAFKKLLASTPNRLVQTSNFQRIEETSLLADAYRCITELAKPIIYPALEYDRQTLIRHALAEKYDEMEHFLSFKNTYSVSCTLLLSAVVSPCGAILDVFEHRTKYSGNQKDVEHSIHVNWWSRGIGEFVAAMRFFLCGWRPTQSLGGKLTCLSNSRGMVSQPSSVATVIIVIKLNFPVSNTISAAGIYSPSISNAQGGEAFHTTVDTSQPHVNLRDETAASSLVLKGRKINPSGPSHRGNITPATNNFQDLSSVPSPGVGHRFTCY